ncbi:methyl-accepting chemotaxis protein [Bacillus sp. AK128]
MKKFKHKLLLIFSVLALILVGVIGAYNIITSFNQNQARIQDYQQDLLQNYDTQIKNQVETAYSLLNDAYQRYQSGEITETEAKEQGAELVKALKYGESGYFWIDDTEGVLIAHPVAPDTEGNDRLNIQDPDGTYLIQNIISAATQNENNGFSEYVWEKPGVDHLVVKRAYSQLFEPWGYIISTGNYIDDIDALVSAKEIEYKEEMVADVRNQIIIIALLLLLSGFIAYSFSNKVSKDIINITEHVKQVASNDLSAQELKISSKDEIGQLAININQMVHNLKSIVIDIVNASEKVTSHSDELFRSSSEVKEGSNQIASTIQELTSGSETQANSASELSYSMSDLVTKIMEANSNSEQISSSSNEVLQLTNDGNQLMTTSIKQMSAIDLIVQEAVKKVQGLDEQSQEISKLIAVIKAIAEQTNLLALNAAIEAARAGEQGKGFAVVADEVRKLAEQVSSSVTDITNIVNGIKSESSQVVTSLQSGYSEVEKGAEQIKLTGKTFGEINSSLSEMISRIQTVTSNLSTITENSSKMNQSIENIAAVSEESAAGIEQTSASVQQTNSSMEEIAGNAGQLSKLADDLNSLVRKFKL